MKNIYISCPVVGRTEENIVRSREVMRKDAELMLGEECHVINENPVSEYIINSDVSEGPIVWCCDCSHAIKALSSHISQMADADVFVGITSDAYVTCSCERDVAHRMCMETILIDFDGCTCFDDVNKRRIVEY